MTCRDIGTNFILTRHTRSRMRLRKVSDAEVAGVLANPEQRTSQILEVSHANRLR